MTRETTRVVNTSEGPADLLPRTLGVRKRFSVNIGGTAGNVTGTVAVGNGGTGGISGPDDVAFSSSGRLLAAANSQAGTVAMFVERWGG